MSLEAGKPLPRIDGAFPSRRIFHMILAGGLAECHLGGSFALSFRQYIATIDLYGLAKFVGLLTSLQER